MTPEEQLGFIEGMSALADALTSMRTNLIDRGWSEAAAEQATIVICPPLLFAAGGGRK